MSSTDLQLICMIWVIYFCQTQRLFSLLLFYLQTPEPAVNPRQEDVIEEDDEFDDEEEEEEDEDWDTDEPARPLTDSTAGRLVCALYDYAAEDQEEISLTKGDVIRLVRHHNFRRGFIKNIVNSNV